MVHIEENLGIRLEATAVQALKFDDHPGLFHGIEASFQRGFGSILDNFVQ